MPRGKKDSLDFIIEIEKDIVAPIFAGQSYGTLRIQSDGEIIAERDLLAAKDIGAAQFFTKIWDLLILFLKGIFNF